eukprot:COSAG05_NODE_2057_length_3631_cov_3.848528_5_plen_105_part_00
MVCVYNTVVHTALLCCQAWLGQRSADSSAHRDLAATDPHLTDTDTAAAPSAAHWPVGSYGGEPTEPSGYQKDFLACGGELAALGRLRTAVRRQLFGQELAAAYR